MWSCNCLKATTGTLVQQVFKTSPNTAKAYDYTYGIIHYACSIQRLAKFIT